MAPSPMANRGIFTPLDFSPNNTSRQLWVDARTPSSMARKCFFPRSFTPIMTRAHRSASTAWWISFCAPACHRSFNESVLASRPSNSIMLFLLMAACPMGCLIVVTSNQPDTPPFFNRLNTRLGDNSKLLHANQRQT